MSPTSPRPEAAASLESLELWPEHYELAYEELRRIARAKLRSGARSPTLHTTALVNEAFVKLSAKDRAFADRRHLLAVAARAMRQVLVDHFRASAASKRGGGAALATLDEEVLDLEGGGDAILAVHEALETLTEFDPRAASVVELRFFGGLTEDEIAEVLGVSKRTVSGEWRLARAWLARELTS